LRERRVPANVRDQERSNAVAVILNRQSSECTKALSGRQRPAL
jgi:hypothetical protein